MSAALMILMQAAAATPGAPLPRDFDLRDHLQLREVPLAIGDRCASDDPAVIVVCATRNGDTYRLGPTAPAGSGPPQAETRLGDGVTGRLRLDSATMPDGTVSKRILITVTAAF